MSTNNTVPENHYKGWTTERDNKLIFDFLESQKENSIPAHLQIAQLANTHGRTKGAIKNRLTILRLLTPTPSINDIRINVLLVKYLQLEKDLKETYNTIHKLEKELNKTRR